MKNVPFAAIEEAVVNAVYHRGYDTREPVEIRITPDEFVVLSYPGPDRSVNLSQLRQGKALPRRYRNRRIGEFLKELKLTEGRSTGIPKIIKEMQENGSPAPEFEFDEDHTFFMVKLPVHPEMNMSSMEDTMEVRPLIIQLTNNLSRKELRQKLNLKNDEHLRTTYINPAISLGLIEMTIPDKPNSRHQKYRLTDRGKSLLNKIEPVESGVESGNKISDLRFKRVDLPETGKGPKALTPIMNRILQMLKNSGPLSKNEIAGSLGKQKPGRYLNELMADMVKQKLVEYTIPEKPNSRLQRYRVAIERKYY